MPPFTIRRASAADAGALARIAAQTFAETFAAENSPEDLALHQQASYGADLQRAEIEDPDVTTLLAFLGEELVGFAQVRRKAAPSCVTSDRPVELHRFYLVRSVQGKGIAAALMRAVHVAGRELGGLSIWLGVWERNPRAIAFYMKSGFQRVGSHVFVVGSDHQTDFVFVGQLSEPVTSAA
jgi:ribosomal protein S18 acetylase RimI-like enzyme